MPEYFVRIGSLAELHAARGAASFDRGRRVLVRTTRGLELGNVVRQRAADQSMEKSGQSATNQIVRGTTEQDEMLIRRLQRHKRKAVESCRDRLRELGSTAMLLDVDQLFDGGTLVMHFVGEVDEKAELVSKSIVAEYESVVRSKHLAKLMSDGCGPGCGTEESGGCSGTCGSCAVASKCRVSSAK